MMRLTWATAVAILISAPTTAQQPAAAPSYAQTRPAASSASGAADSMNRGAAQGQPPAAPATEPFPPLSAAAQAQLQDVLEKWEYQSKGTKTLECKFRRWSYDLFGAPAGVYAKAAEGVLKYSEPDKGLFRVDKVVSYAGMVEGKPQYKESPGEYGDYWVCNGKQLIEYDRTQQQCRIQELPPEMQGQNIVSSPLPFVFNLDARQIQERYWVRQMPAPNQGLVLIEAWPKRQEDRAQYKLVQIALDASTFLPHALVLYAPNFDAKTAPKYEQYDLSDVKRNAIGAQIQGFLKNFIPEQPPANWKILHDKFTPIADAPVERAAEAPASTQTR